MARYIDANRLIERLKASPIFQDFNTDGYFIRDMVIDLVECQQIADVVPRVEIEREIGEEIHRIIGECHNETWVCLLIRKLADKLTKKNESQN